MPRRRGRLRSITPVERAAVTGIAALAAIGAVAAGAHPTPHLFGDVLLAIAFATLITLASSVARTWAWIVLASGAAIFAAPSYPVAAFAVEGIALLAAAVDISWRRVYGALVGATSAQLLLRLGAGPFLGSTALVATLVSLPVFVTSWSLVRRSTRRRVRRAAYVVGAGAGVALLAAAFTLLQLRTSANQASTHMQSAISAARAGDTRTATNELAEAARSLSDAKSQAGSWLLSPIRVAPVLGQQIETIEHLAATGETAAASASKAVQEADVDSLRMRGGRIDVTKVAATATPLAALRQALAGVQREVNAPRSPWLLSPVATRIDKMGQQIDKAVDDARTASDVVAIAPDMLGAKGPRRYFVAFGQPAEARDLGGFLGGFGELIIDNGKLSLIRVGKAGDLNEGGPHPLTDPDVLPERYRAFSLDRYWENITASPDLPTVARAVAQLWPQSGGEPLDGVLYVDPAGLAALLKLTGPVATGFGELTADNAVQFLTRDQYTQFQVADQRHDLLADSAKVVFDKLTSSDLPGPAQIANTLGDPAHGGHFMLFSYHDAEERLIAEFGIDGSLPPVDTDSLLVTTSNRGTNKLDAFLTRAVRDQVEVDPSTGAIQSTITITLHNDAPADGLPDYVSANTLGEPRGTNDTVVSVWTPLQLDTARLDGSVARFDSDHAYGRYGYALEAVVPPGGTRTFELHLHGRSSDPAGYRLVAASRSAVDDQPFELEVSAASGWKIAKQEGLDRAGNAAEAREVLVNQKTFRVGFARL